MAYDIQLVASISASASVRLDLSAPAYNVTSGTTFGMPALRRAVVSTLLTDGERYPAAAYGNRIINLVVQLRGATDDAIATSLQALVRELDRPGNILRYRPGTSTPVYFRTFRCGPSDLRWDPVLKEVTAQIPAEPFAVGPRVDLAPVTVANNPATGCYFEVTGVLGDVESPLYLSVDPAIQVDGPNTTAIAVRRRGTPSAAPSILQAEAMTSASLDTTIQANDAAMSGGGQNFMRCTFASGATLTSRLSITTWPAGASPDMRGTYRMYVRWRKSVAGDVITMRWRINSGGPLYDGDTYTLPTVLGPAWQDLGLISLPFGLDPVRDGISGVELSAGGLTQLLLQAGRTSGSGNLDLDCLLLLPADDRFDLVRWPAFGGPTKLVLDATRNWSYALGASGEVRGADLAQIAGGAPMVSPGVTNRIWFLRNVSGSADVLSRTTDITPYYWPRYLYVAAP